MARLIYSGDVNAAHGGQFYTLHNWKWGYVSMVEIQPCSDAGGPDNCYWVEKLTINVERSRADIERALQCIGQTWESLKEVKRAARRHIIIDACKAYGYFDKESSEMVRIGKPDPFYSGREGEFNPDKLLRGNASIRNYAHAVAMEHCA